MKIEIKESFLAVAFIVLLVIKLTGLAHISWFVVFSPALIYLAIVCIAIFVTLLLLFVAFIKFIIRNYYD